MQQSTVGGLSAVQLSESSSLAWDAAPLPSTSSSSRRAGIRVAGRQIDSSGRARTATHRAWYGVLVLLVLLVLLVVLLSCLLR